MPLAEQLETAVKDRLEKSPQPAGFDGDEVDTVGKKTYSDLCRFIADGTPPEEVSASVEGGVDIDVLPAVTALAALIAAAKNLYELYEKLAERLRRKPTQGEFEAETPKIADKTLVLIVYVRASERQ